MAIAYVNSTNKDQVNASSCTYSHTVNAGTDLFLAVSVIAYTTDNITGVTYAGTAMTQVGKKLTGSGGRWMYLYVLHNPSTGTNNVVVSASGTTYISSQAATYTGVTQSSTVHVSNTNSGTTSSLTTSVTTTLDNCWLIMAGAGYGDELKAGTGTTERQGNGSGLSIFDSDGAKSPAGSYSLVAASNGGVSAQIAVVLAAIAPSAAAASGPASLKTRDTIAKASVKTIDGIAIASVKSIDTIT